MDSLAAQNPESLEDGYTQDDIYGQVMGPEKNGRVRTFGLGVTPTGVFGNKSNRVSQVERRETESQHQLELERVQREMQADFECKQVEMEKQMRTIVEAQMENQFNEKVAAMQVEIENKMQAKMYDKFEAYLNAIGFLPTSPQDVSSGTGQVPEESSAERQTQLPQLHQQEKQMERPILYQSNTQAQQPRQLPIGPQIISRSQLLNFRQGRMQKKAKK